MQQYQVPQFITVEDKVIGPLTAKQFLFLGAAAGIIILARTFLVSFLFFPIALVVAIAGGALAFVKINDVPFHQVIRSAIRFFFKPRLYVWRKQTKKETSTPSTALPQQTVSATPKLSQSRLSDLAWSLNIREKYRGQGSQRVDAPSSDLNQ
jgi:hypothetical protein